LLSAAQASSFLSRFRKHLPRRYFPSQVTPAMVSEAMPLAHRHRLRAYDAVQLAALDVHRDWSANQFGAFVFVSSDRALNAAATAEASKVEDPNLHP
jgi:predicted nucleic acid-binding protein